MTANDHFEQLYGDLNLSPNSAVKTIFLSGWNAAMQEASNQVNAMPFGNDTRASFSVYFQQMMEVEPSEIVKGETE